MSKTTMKTVDKWLKGARAELAPSTASGRVSYGVFELLVAVEQLAEVTRGIIESEQARSADSSAANPKPLTKGD